MQGVLAQLAAEDLRMTLPAGGSNYESTEVRKYGSTEKTREPMMHTGEHRSGSRSSVFIRVDRWFHVLPFSADPEWHGVGDVFAVNPTAVRPAGCDPCPACPLHTIGREGRTFIHATR